MDKQQTSENGIYEVSSVDELASYVSLARASNFDSTEEFSTGSFVFVEKEGTLVGQGYVLGELASDFALGTSPINYVQFTIDTSADIAFDQQVSTGDLSVSGNTALGGNVGVSGELDVSGRLRADRLEVESPNGTTRFDGMHNQIGGDYLDINVMDTNVGMVSLMYLGG